MGHRNLDFLVFDGRILALMMYVLDPLSVKMFFDELDKVRMLWIGVVFGLRNSLVLRHVV